MLEMPYDVSLSLLLPLLPAALLWAILIRPTGVPPLS